MKSITCFLSLSLISLSANCQAIRFSSLSWRDALTKAHSEKKILFVEMFTPWCTYCRQMERDVFTTKEASDFYNQHFINVRYDALKNDGIQIRRNYSLLGFPTFLYLNPDGLILLKTAGFQPKEKFISNGDSAVLVEVRKRND